MYIATMKISSAKTIITFVVSYNAISVSTQINSNEPNVSLVNQKQLCSIGQSIFYSELNVYL